MTTVVSRDDLIREMRRLGIRVTAQRLAVAEVLINAEDHPTAQEVYDRVQERFPHITMGTVYNTINTLAATGLIQPLPFANGTRYDANRTPHANLVCVRCGSIIDADDEEGVVGKLRARIEDKRAFRVIAQRLDFYGLCAECGTKQSRRQAKR